MFLLKKVSKTAVTKKIKNKNKGELEVKQRKVAVSG